ncbi:hypothetical protein EJB05_50268, partial [Eragrostis curvula]
MEPGADWVSCDQLQLASWAMEPAAPGFPVEFVSTEMFGICHQTSTPSSTQLVKYEAATHCDPIEKEAQAFEIDSDNMEVIIHNPIHVFEEAAQEVEINADLMRMKIHKYPASMRDLDKRYREPNIVAIGPHHHGKDHLMHAEKMKHAAAYHCITESGHSVQEIYDDVVSVADYARALYDTDVVAGIGDNDFLPMMFYDACFLVQYMLYVACFYQQDYSEMDSSLVSYFDSNDDAIYHDIMLLDNQLPWLVVEAVMRFRPVNMKHFIACLRDCLQEVSVKDDEFELDANFQPPHLLGLLRFYIVGRSKNKLEKDPSLYLTVSPSELAEVGISLKANEKIDLTDMCIKKRGPFFADLCMPPLQLDARPSWLINMAALEICMSSDFLEEEDEYSAVCSYLNLLTMLVHREADVYDLRKKGLLQGGGGFTDQEALAFFSSLRSLRHGSSYIRTIVDIQDYMRKRPTRTKVHAFIYRNIKIITTFFSALVALIGILGTLKSLKVP